MNLSKVSKLSEDQARAYFERLRWPNGPTCPHCLSTKHLKLEGRTVRPGLYKCHGDKCGKQYTATVNTILEDSHLPIRTWLMAFAIMCSSKKGVSALQLQRQLGLGSYRSAWHLCHRIRHAMSKEPMSGLLGKDGRRGCGRNIRWGQKPYPLWREAPVWAVYQKDPRCGAGRARRSRTRPQDGEAN